jgi:predicted ATPase
VIKKLWLSGFKAFSTAEIPLGPLTLLSGVNGSGKSTVLQSLAALKQSFDAECLSLKGGLLLNGDYVDLGVGKDVLCEQAEEQQISIGFETERSSYLWVFAYKESDDLLQIVSDVPSSLEDAHWLAGGFQFLRADRIAPAVVYPKSFNETIRKRSLGVRGQYAPYFLAVHQDEQVSPDRVRDDAVSARLIDQVNAWLREISPGVSVSASEIGGADLAQLLYRYGGSAGLGSSNDYRPTNVGFGLTYALPIVIACLSARQNDLLLLENPEAHLHPRGQSAMGDLLARTANDGVQVIVESHSDHMLNGIRLAVRNKRIDPTTVQIHFFQRVSSGAGADFSSPAIDSDGRLSAWPDGFFDEWERSLMELV